MSRVTNLPLVSSACEAVSSAYTSTKDSVPLLKGVMDAAESGVRTLGAAASSGSKPLLDMMEPQSKVPPSKSHMMPSAAGICNESTFQISATQMLFSVQFVAFKAVALTPKSEFLFKCLDFYHLSFVLWLWVMSNRQHLNRGRRVIAVSSGVSLSVATVNQYAMKGLDKMEEKLPILHQPAEQVTQNHRTFIVAGT